MKKSIFYITLILVIAFNGLVFQSFGQETKKTIPAVNIQDLNGKTVNTGSFNNGDKPLIMIFWTSVYKIPAKELDAINENYEDWKKETGVKVIAISVDDSRTASRVAPLVSGKGWQFDTYIDINSDFKRQMNVNLLPHVFIINGAGVIVWQKVGYNEGDESMVEEQLIKLNRNK